MLPSGKEDEKKPIFHHLEELRRRVLLSLLSIIVFSVLSYSYADKIIKELGRFVDRLIFISPQEAFIAHLKVSLTSGIILSGPIILYQVIRFIWISLKKREKALFGAYFVLASVLFMVGVAFSYFVALPVAINFLLGFSSDFVRPYISISRYISFAAFLLIAFGVAFEIPIFTILLSRSGLVSSRVLRQKRPYVIVFLFVLAAFLTPPDVITQILLVVPLILLYEISVWLAVLIEKK